MTHLNGKHILYEPAQPVRQLIALASSESSDEPAHICSLARAVSSRIQRVCSIGISICIYEDCSVAVMDHCKQTA